MSVLPSDLVSLSDRLLVACDQSYEGEKLVAGTDHLKPYFDLPLGEKYKPPYAFDFPRDLVSFSFEDAKSGFKCVIYQNTETYEIIVAMGGTDGTDLKDWWANVTHYGWNQWSHNRSLVLNALENLIQVTRFEHNQDPNILFTGQSLGGALAQYAAYEFEETHEGYPRTELALITFNALGGIAALRDEIPKRDPFENLGFPGFHDDVFLPTRVSDFALVAHYWNDNDLVTRAGEGHLGGNVLEFPGQDFSHLNAVTNQPYRLDTISAHKIESGYYYPLTEYANSNIDGFASAALTGPFNISALKGFYLPLTSLQKVASVMGNLFREDATSTPGAFAQLLIGGLGAIVAGERDEVNGLVDAYIDTRYLAGQYENNDAEYTIAKDTDWSFRLRVGAAALGIGPLAAGPFGFVFSMVGALALAPVFKLVEAISSDQAQFLLRTKLDSGWIGVSLPDSQAEEVLQRSDMLGAALNVSDPRGSGIRLATVAHLSRGATEELADAMDDEDGNWYSDTATFLVERANALGEQTHAPQAETEFWSYSRQAAAGNADLLTSIYDQSREFVSDWQTAVAGVSSDLAESKNSPLSIAGLETYEQKNSFWNAALSGLDGMLDLFVGTAHAEEFRAAASKALDQARAGAQSVVVRQGRPLGSFPTTDFDPNASASLGALSEGSVRTFTLYLPYDAGTGGQRVKLTLAGSAADRLTLLDHADEIALGTDSAFTLVVPEGRKELSFSLWARRDIDAAATLALSAQLVDSAGVATHLEHIELNLALDGVDEVLPVTGREIRGDWAPTPYVDSTTGETYYKYDDLGNIERLSGVPSTGDVEPDQWLDGSSGADLIVTGDFDEQAHGDAGDDFITGSEQSGNILFGGSGNDRIEGGGWTNHAAEYWEWEYLGRPMGLGDDKIYGGAGDDQIWGESEATQAALNDAGTAPTGITGDWVTGGSGADRIYGSAGDDVLLGGVGEDLLVGGAGMDVLLGDDDFQIRPTGNYWQVVHPNFGDATPGFGNFEVGLFPVVNAASIAPDLIWAMTGDADFAYYKFGGGADVLIGGGGSDILIGQAGDDTLYGGEGDDILAGWEGDDELIGGAGDDLMAGDFGRYEQVNQRTVPGTLLVQAGVMGTSAAFGSAVELTGNDLLDGGAGDDVLYGEGGDDAVLGGDGDDTLYGDAVYLPESLHGNDILDGGDGADSLYAGAGDDTLYGGAGDDALWGEQGDDTLHAGDGDDALFGGEGDDVIDAHAGDDYAEAGAGNDIVRGGPGADDLEAWGEGNNLLDAGPGNDYVYDEGRTLVIGGAGDDWIDHSGDGGVVAFNPGDGDDTVYAAGAMTLSIGGGVQPGDLSLAQDGTDLLLDVAGAGSIRLTRQWEADPAAWPEITLQLFGSVHLYDFNSAIGTEGPLGDVLAANETSFSETEGIGGAIAWRYAIAGSTGALSDEQLRSVLADPGFGTASQPIMLEQPNRPPELAAPIADQSTLEDSLFELSVAAAFSDPDAADTPSFDAALADGSPLPAWLAFDAAGGFLFGTPGNDDVGTLEIAVGATDGGGERAADAFMLEVLNVNDAPTLVAPLADRIGQEGAALAFSVAGAFADVDAGDALAYAATLADGGALPGWLAFDPANRSFSAAPGYADGGGYLVRVTATDTAGASASGEFTLEILESEAPVEPDGDGHYGRHDEDHHHPHHRREHDHDRDDEHEKHKPRHDPVHEWLAKPHHFEFDAIVRELERGKPEHAPSPAQIRTAWERVARHAAKLGAGGDEFEHAAAWHGSDLLRLAPDGGRGFGFDASIGARAQEGFISFNGLSEGFRRLR